MARFADVDDPVLFEGRARERGRVRVTARRRGEEGFTHDVEIEGGHKLVVDEPAAAGGADLGPKPTLLLASSLAGCTAITMELYAARKGWDLGEVEVDVDVDLREGAARPPSTVSIRALRRARRRAAGRGC